MTKADNPVERDCSTWAECLLGIWPILSFGLTAILYEAGIDLFMKGFMTNFILYFTLLMVAGFGWLKGSPRWSYATTGFLVLFTWYRMEFKIPAIHFLGFHLPATGQFWGWRAWIPFLTAVLIVLIIARSVRPVVVFFQNMRKDWTRFAFGIYGMVPLISWWFFDEIRAPGLEIVSLGTVTLFLLSGALVYLRSEEASRRLTALLAGLLPVWLIVILVPAFYWHGRQVPYLPKPINGYEQIIPGLIFAATITLGMFLPGLYSLFRMKILKHKTG